MISLKDKIVAGIMQTLAGRDTTFNEKLQDIIQVVSKHFKVKKCSVMLINQDDLTLEVRASTNPSIIGLKRKLSDVTIATRALIDDVPFYADGKRRSFFTPLDSSQYASEYSLSIPIKHLDKKLGVINLTDTADGKPLTEEQELQISGIIEYLSPYIYAIQLKDVCDVKIGKLVEANERLIKLDELKTNLTNFIVHDLKGPISTIMANLDMLSYEQLTPGQFEYLDLATEDIYKMQRMVMNILDVLKLEEGRINIYREEADIYEIAQREAVSFKSVLSRRNMELALDGAPRICYIDENLIGRTISNLMMNAIEHSPDDKKIALTVRYDADKRESVVSVADQGIGVPDEMKEKIFDKFFQIDGGKKQRKTTTGLGLTFCQLVVNAHGGNIRVEDSEDGGAKIVFTLPETLKEVVR